MFICIYVYMYICIYVMYICIYVYKYIYKRANEIYIQKKLQHMDSMSLFIMQSEKHSTISMRDISAFFLIEHFYNNYNTRIFHAGYGTNKPGPASLKNRIKFRPTKINIIIYVQEFLFNFHNILNTHFKKRTRHLTHTACPRSSDPFYIGSYYIKWVTYFFDIQ